MKEVRNRVDVEEAAVIDYVIRGILDNEANKVILYGAEDLNDLKEKFRVYSKFKESQQIKKSENSVQRPLDKEIDRCFNCGDITHRAKFCRNKSKGTKCFKCNEYGCFYKP